MLKTRSGKTVGTAGPSASDTGDHVIQRIYRRDEMPAITGYTVDHIYELIKIGEFPRPIPLGPRAVGWVGSEIARWQRERIAARDAREQAEDVEATA